MRWTLKEFAGALGIVPPKGVDAHACPTGVSIDSRTIRAGELFVAIHGPRHDGHTFVASALASGALAAVVARSELGEFPEQLRGKLLAVDDTLAALQELAHTVRCSWGGPVVAVAGSVGKTTTKEILAALLAAKFRVLKSEGNLNNEYGLPLTLLRLEAAHEIAVVELGMSHRGELARLCQIAEPNVGVVTCVAVEHLEFFSSVEEIALAERELIEGLAGEHPVAVLNADDARVVRFAEAARGRVLWFGLGPTAPFRAERMEEHGLEGNLFDFVSPNGRTRLRLPLVSRHNVLNAIAALAAASVWGVGASEAQRVFPELAPPAMRGEVLRFTDGFTVLNDCYNSSPAALGSMAEWLASVPGFRRRILAAGEMLELGPASSSLHAEAGRRVVASGGIDWIIGVQGNAASLIDGAVQAGYPSARTRFFDSSQEAAEFLAEFVTSGDLLLVKGSRGVRMERIVEALGRRHAPAGEASPGLAGGAEESPAVPRTGKEQR